MILNPEKVKYNPTTEGRYVVSKDPFSTDRFNALQYAYEEIRSLNIPFFAGISVGGSLTKGKVLTESTYTASDIDVNVFLDHEMLESPETAQFAASNRQFQQLRTAAMYQSYWGTPQEVQQAQTGFAASQYLGGMVKSTIFERIVASRLQDPRHVKISLQTSFISKENTQGPIAALDRLKSVTLDPSFLSPEDRTELSALFAGFDLGNDLQLYRRIVLHTLAKLPTDEGEVKWSYLARVIAYWERNNDIPAVLQKEYPSTLEDALRYYR